MKRRPSLWAWLGMIAATLLLYILPHCLAPSAPKTGLRLAAASFQPEGGREAEIDLPFLWSPRFDRNSGSAVFRLTFDLTSQHQRPLALYIPAARQPLEISLNGQIIGAETRPDWASARGGYFRQTTLPDAALKDSGNLLELTIQRSTDYNSAYLSEIYILPDADLAETLRLRDLLLEQGRAMLLSLHFLLFVSVLAIMAMRRHDALFRWFSLIGLTSLGSVLLQSPALALWLTDARGALFVLQAMTGLLLLRTAFVVAGTRPSPLQARMMLAIPAVLIALQISSGLPMALGHLTAALVVVGSFLCAALLLTQHFARERDWVAAVLAPACGLAALCALHDILVALGWSADDLMIAPYARFWLMAAVMALLIGHLIQSLNRGDASQALMQQRLAEQEQELRRLHQEERERMGQQILMRERERLMRDLHDGISGHLVSILAQAEQQGDPGHGIRQSAGEALSDLRMVVQSLDLGEDDMRLALTGFYERIQPQLRRQGVQLDWSMEKLPEVSGMSSGMALALLRILQEAVTNALKHGPAKVIRITGAPGPNGGAEIRVQNDRQPGEARTQSRGNGLTNMRRRAQSLGGEVKLTLSPTQAVLSLVLPLRLVDHSGGTR